QDRRQRGLEVRGLGRLLRVELRGVRKQTNELDGVVPRPLLWQYRTRVAKRHPRPAHVEGKPGVEVLCHGKEPPPELGVDLLAWRVQDGLLRWLEVEACGFDHVHEDAACHPGGVVCPCYAEVDYAEEPRRDGRGCRYVGDGLLQGHPCGLDQIKLHGSGARE